MRRALVSSFALLLLPGCSALLEADFFDGHLRVDASGGDAVDAAATDAGDTAKPESERITIAAGGGSTCAISSAGGVKCWGDNTDGQLGVGATGLGSRVPVDVIGIDAQVRSLSVGNSHACAVTVGGAARCWGSNRHGELGDGTNDPSTVAKRVVGLTAGVASVMAAMEFTCALMTSGEVKCWGLNAEGQLGDGDNTDSNVPVDVQAISTATAVVGGGSHACAKKSSGEVVCWGDGNQNQLGTYRSSSNVPIRVAKLDSIVTSLAAGWAHTCALSGRGVECWGANQYGQLGGGAASANEEYVVVGAFAGAVAVGAGAEHSCVLTDAGAKCWGNGENGRLGNDSNLLSRDPVAVAGLPASLRAITSSATAAHTCVRRVDDGIMCWGMNRVGRLGDDTLVDAWTPVAVVGFP